ncbi:MAG: mechanosensitive ion channel family protein, partial [Chitinophagaceae bacterium]
IYWGNTVQAYLMAAAGIFITWAVIRTLRRVVLKRVAKWIQNTDTSFDDILLSVVEKYVLPYVYLFINFHIITDLNLSARTLKILTYAMAFITLYYGVRLVIHAITLSINGLMKRRNESAERIRQLNGVMIVVKALLWFIGFIVMLGNLGFDVRAMITGLGVGGIAIALAAQTVLGDLFSYFVIFFDKPFEIGDFVKTGASSGTIEQIGIKTTRLRSLDGEQLVISNTDLLKTTIHNYKRLERRRVVFTIAVTYHTDADMLRQIPMIVREIVESQADTVFDRAHFSKMDVSSLNFDVVYNIDSPDYTKFMDTQQTVLLKLIDGFRERGIEFAHPTQNIYLKGKFGKALPQGDTNPANATSETSSGDQ